jgi:putative membrane-bound dehydrogenase-like protein
MPFEHPSFLLRAAHSLWLMLLICLGISAWPLSGADLIAVPEFGLRVARGFRVSLFADANLANDIYAMTLDPRGNIVVTSQGYVKTLVDRDGDGVAEEAIDFAETRTGGMGLCFDGNDLLLMADGGLWRLRDANGDGVADGPAQKLYGFHFAEHGGHAIRQGPDGRWYVIAGNENKFDDPRLAVPSAAGRRIEAGALLCFSGDFRDAETFAHGFRNPYDFDFNPDGDIFTCDSDCERDYFLPWYEPTRVYHVAPSQHHGWRLPGWMRSWPRPGNYSDTVDILAGIGRGSPTGVTCYRHLQFPEAYREGLFALDWTFGKVYFLPIRPVGASYQSALEVFLESVGSQGFAPTDAVIGPDGSLFISTGGRKTRGAVYRIQYVAEPALAWTATNWIDLALTELRAVLQAPQPLEAWSRAWWEPVAERLGADPFLEAATDSGLLPEQRMRAIEVLTDVHDGLPTATARTIAQASSPFVRARMAWSLGTLPCPDFGPILLGLARDVGANVRVQALEAMRRHLPDLNLPTVQQALALNLAHPEKRVRLAAAALAADLPEPAWKALWAQQQTGLPQARLTTALASLWRGSPSQINSDAAESALTVLRQSKIPELQLQSVRLLLLALGDYRLENASLEVFTGYEPALPLAESGALVAKIRQTVSSLFPTRDSAVDFELARLLAFVEANDSALPEKISLLFSDRSEPSTDFHYLAALARMKSPCPTNVLPKLGSTIASLDRKLDGMELRPKQNWTVRLSEVVQVLLKRDPSLRDSILRHPDFPRPGNLALVPLLGSERYLASARLYLGAVQHNPNFPWTADLVDLLAALPSNEALPLFRRQWSNVALRDRLVLELAGQPRSGDRDKFVTALSSTQPQAVRAAMSALLQLPPDTSGKAVAAALKVLRRALSDPNEQAIRAQAVALLSHWSAQPFRVSERAGPEAFQPIFAWFDIKYPGVLRQLDAADGENPAAWDRFYKNVPWARGDTARGETLFRDRGCQTCHGSSQTIAPDLAGVASRMSPADLFNAIIFPSRDVAPAYRMTTFQIRDGSSYTGLVAFESADGVIVRTGLDSTVRLAESDIQSRQPSDFSFMPNGLLRGLSPQEFADLYSYLKTLHPER